MTLQSPKTGETLELIDGDAEGIRRHALDLISSGDAMDRAANRLEDISNGTSDLKSEAISKVRESAGEVFPDLRKAATRYNLTGEALKTYSSALEDVQGIFPLCTAQGGIDNFPTMNALIEEIKDINETAESKRNAEDDARDLVSEHDGFLGMGEGTDKQKEDAANGLTKATAAREDAEEELDELWGKFDARVSYWEDAYDDAVTGIEEAFDEAGNNDKWYDDLKKYLGYAALLLTIAAIVFGAPFLAVLALVASAIVLVIEVYKMLAGEGNLVDLGLAIVGIIPFGRVLGSLAKGVKFSKSGIKILGKTRNSVGRGIVRNSIKGKTPRPVKTKIRGKRATKKSIRRNNRKLEKQYQSRNRQDGLRRGDNYLKQFDESFEGSWKRYVSYAADGGSARYRAMAEYIKKNPGDLGPEALQWARGTRNLAKGEDMFTFGVQLSAAVWGETRSK